MLHPYQTTLQSVSRQLSNYPPVILSYLYFVDGRLTGHIWISSSFDQIHSKKKKFSCHKIEFNVFQFVPITSFPVNGHYWEQFDFIFIPSHQGIICAEKFPLRSFSPPQLSSPQTFNLFLFEQCSNTLTIFGALWALWDPETCFMSFLFWELDTALHKSPHQCCTIERKIKLPQTAGNLLKITAYLLR